MSWVLDTHVFVRWFEDPRKLSKQQQRVLKRVGPERPAYISDITLWEVAMLVSLGRLRPKIPLREWFENALERPFLEVHPLSPAVACEVAHLGNALHADPADRFIIGTARVLGLPLLTSDELIIESKAVETIGLGACTALKPRQPHNPASHSPTASIPSSSRPMTLGSTRSHPHTNRHL